MPIYRFVACFTGECCQRPHLWGKTVMAKSLEQARKKALREIQQDGREVTEIVEVTHGFGEVYSLEEGS